MPTTDILLIIFIAIVAISLFGQWMVMLALARRFQRLAEKVEPLLPQVAQLAATLGPLLRDVQGLVADTRPKLDMVSANLAEMSALARDQLRRADAFATDLGARVELQMVRVDEALGSALATVDMVSATVRETVLRPVQDVNALVQGVRTGLDFFFRRRPSSAARPPYHDEEMFI